MKATLTFTLPEEQEEFDRTQQAGKMHSALFEISNEIFRPARKHGYNDERLHALIFHLDQAAATLGANNEAWPKDEYGPLGATDLIQILEEKCYSILRENGVDI